MHNLVLVHHSHGSCQSPIRLFRICQTSLVYVGQSSSNAIPVFYDLGYRRPVFHTCRYNGVGVHFRWIIHIWVDTCIYRLARDSCSVMTGRRRTSLEHIWEMGWLGVWLLEIPLFACINTISIDESDMPDIRYPHSCGYPRNLEYVRDRRGRYV